MRRPLDSWAPARRRQALAAGGVLLVVVVLVAGWLAVRALRPVEPVAQSEPGPVVLVPGYGGTTADLAPLVAELRREGRQAVVYEPTDHEHGDLRVQAERLADLVDRTLRRSDAPSVDVVGYSAGGIIARIFVRDDDGAGQVRRVLTLGSPHHGTDLAETAKGLAGSCPTACEQMAPGSELLDHLDAGDETPAGPRWITLRTQADTVVTPPESAVLDGALNLRVQDFCPAARTTHGELPGDPVTLALLPAALGPGPPHPPRAVHC